MNRTPEAVFTELQDAGVIKNSKQYGKWTIPSITANLNGMPVQYRKALPMDEAADLGAILVNNLAARLVGVLFPVSREFFRVRATAPSLKKKLEEHGYTETKTADALTMLTVQAQQALYGQRGHAALMQTLRHLIITGNACIYRDSDRRTMKVYGLGNYVTQRSFDGTLVQAVVKEGIPLRALPKDIQNKLYSRDGIPENPDKIVVDRHWWIIRENRGPHIGYTVREFAKDIEVKSPDWYREEELPWIFAYWNLVPGEHYGRSHVEEYATGFKILSHLNAASLKYAMGMLRVIFLVGPSAATQPGELAKAQDGQFVVADGTQVTPFELPNNGGKLQQVDAKIDAVIQRLSKAFMYDGIVRNAERVTAYELQRDAHQAEQLLGGVYNTLAGLLQVPLARLAVLEVLPELLADLHLKAWDIDILEGSASLGQADRSDRLLQALQQWGAALPIVQADPDLSPEKVRKEIFTGAGFPVGDIAKSEEEKQADREAAEAQAQAQQGMAAADMAADQSQQLAQAMGG